MRVFVVNERRWFFQMCLTITLTLTASDTTNDDRETVETWLWTGLWTVNNRPTLHCRDFLSCRRLWDDTGTPWRHHIWPLYIMIHNHLVTTNNNSSTVVLLTLTHIITVQTCTLWVTRCFIITVANVNRFFHQKIPAEGLYVQWWRLDISLPC